MASVVVIKDGLHTGANPATPTVGVVTAEDARLSNGAGFARLSSGLAVRTGVLYHGVQTILSSSATTAPSMTVNVAGLAAVTQKAIAEGVYVPSSTGNTVLDIAPAPGANSRIDVVYVMQRDASSLTSPDGVTQAELGVVTGTAGATPAKPAIPVGAVEVGTVTVSAGATATNNATVAIATTCRWTVPLGAPIPVRNAAERDLIVGYDGMVVDRLDLECLERHDGATWYEPGTSFVRARMGTLGNYGSAWTNIGMVQDGAIRGASLGFNAPGITILRAGLYRLTLNLTAHTLNGSVVGVAGRLWNGSTTFCQEWSGTPTNFYVSASADVALPAGNTIYASVLASGGTISVDADAGGTTACGFTVTKIPG